eukprot:3830382-Rhodomonas_salina.1
MAGDYTVEEESGLLVHPYLSTVNPAVCKCIIDSFYLTFSLPPQKKHSRAPILLSIAATGTLNPLPLQSQSLEPEETWLFRSRTLQASEGQPSDCNGSHRDLSHPNLRLTQPASPSQFTAHRSTPSRFTAHTTQPR